jgi:hypothetical protein
VALLTTPLRRASLSRIAAVLLLGAAGLTAQTPVSPVLLTFPAATPGSETTLSVAGVAAAASGVPFETAEAHFELAMGADTDWRPGEMTTATWMAPAAVCIHYVGANFSDAAGLQLLHYGDGEWTNATTSHDISAHTICADVPRPPARLVVTVQDAQSAAPIAGAQVQVSDGLGSVVETLTSDTAGRAITAALEPGSYHLLTLGAAVGYGDERYPDLPCGSGASCGAGVAIEVSAETKVPVTVALARLGAIEGIVTDRAGAVPLSKMTVQIDHLSGLSSREVSTDAKRHYRAEGLASRAYVVTAQGSGKYLRETYDNRVCSGRCEVTPVRVDPGETSSVDFQLLPRLPVGTGGLAGAVRDDATGAALDGVTVEIVDSTGIVLVTTVTAGGQFLTPDLPTGMYSVRTKDALGYVDRVHGNVAYQAGQLASYAYLDIRLHKANR